MKPFNELIKNFDKIRGYLRDFSVYGYKQREDFSHKSLRTYDNEKRRIQSYLAPYIHEETSHKGKWLCINFDYLSVTANPLFEGFKTRSFTKNDIMLHFVLLDLLMDFDKLSINELYDKLITNYLENFDDCKLIDQRTLRLKLQEYIKNGLILERREGKTSYYSLAPDPLFGLPDETLSHLDHTLSFYQNTAPLGIIGHFILDRKNGCLPYFAFSGLHFSNTVDDLLAAQLFTAISNHCSVTFFHQKKTKSTALPLKIVDNVEQGRRYVIVYLYQDASYKFYRLDRLESVELNRYTDPLFTYRVPIANALLKTAWGTALKNADPVYKLETWDLLLHIDEENEASLLKQITSSHQDAILQKTAPDTFAYRLSILNAQEAVPWLRQLTGHIISIKCSNEMALKRFIKDIFDMQSYYKEENDDTF